MKLLGLYRSRPGELALLLPVAPCCSSKSKALETQATDGTFGVEYSRKLLRSVFPDEDGGQGLGGEFVGELAVAGGRWLKQRGESAVRFKSLKGCLSGQN